MHDLILVGGGLANGLIAWRLKQVRPDLKVLLVEKDDAVGGNHTWSFYEHDLTPSQHDWLGPMVSSQWPAYEVRFPTHRRIVETACYSISSERFRQALTAALGDAIVLNASATDIGRQAVRVDGRLLHAQAVVDGRGHAVSQDMRYAYQKFIGQEVRLRHPHGQHLPIIMDATVPQTDGYRFVYTLPFDATRILIEDTYYSDTPGLDAGVIRSRLAAYAGSRGWQIADIIREEAGVLPIALSGDIDGFWESKTAGLPCSGLRAGLFHATTGYSLLYAVRLADAIARLPSLDAESVYRHIRAFSAKQWRAQLFMRSLNRMMFFAGEPSQRYRLLQRFYTLPQQCIERFFAANLTFADKVRILSGKPPVPVFAAVKAMFQTGKKI